MIREKKSSGPIGQLIGGMIFVSAGIAVVYFLGSDYTFSCNRAENRCVIQEENIFRENDIAATLNMSDIRKAEVVESRDSKGKSSYQVMLETDRMRIPISDVRTGSYGACNKNATRINTYLNSSDNDLALTVSGTFLKIFGFVFAAAGGFLLLQSLGGLLKLLLNAILVVASLFGK